MQQPALEPIIRQKLSRSPNRRERSRIKGTFSVARYWHRFRRLITHNVLHADDTPHSIALGASIAMFIAILPLVGIQMFVAVALAALVRANKAICIPVVWISNPLTMFPIYGGCLALGKWLMNSKAPVEPAVALSGLAEPARIVSWVELEYWTALFSRLAGMGVELWVGCIVVGIPVALLTYPVSLWLVSAYRERRRIRLAQRKVFRAPISESAANRKSEVA